MPESTGKLCPMAIGRPNTESALCREAKCALFVKVVKPAYIAKGIIDPECFYCYEGCGLVQVVPWKLENRPEKRNPQ